MEGGSSALLPVAQQTQAQASPGQPVIYQQPFAPGQPITAAPGQPIMYQMPPGQQQQQQQQQQPVFVQVPAGQPATTADGQPIQYYYVPMQPGQQGQPGQPVQQEQPVYVQSPSGQPGQPQQQAGQGLGLTFDTNFIKSPLCYIKIAEFVVLLGAWASILKYLDDFDDVTKKSKTVVYDDKADFFKGITIFCWVMVIFYLIINIISLPKICNCKRPSMFTLASLIFYFIMFALLLACTGNLVSRAVDFGKALKLGDAIKKLYRPFVVALGFALTFGFLSCIAFVVDMVLNYKLFQTQREQETPPEQGPPQRRVWDINSDYLRSPVFYVKLAEIAVLFGAWVCIVKYLDMDIIKLNELKGVDPPAILAIPETDFFKGITIFAWVMVILLALTSVLSFDKLCSRSSLWTLTTLVIYFILSILLIACCGTLTKPAVDLGKLYKDVIKSQKRNILALFIGLAFGFVSCIVFVVDMVLNYKLFQTQRALETPPEQGPPQRRVWDINSDYLRSPVFYVKLAEIAVLFGAWVCIVKYLDMDLFKQYDLKGLDPPEILAIPETDFFKGITIFAWTLVIYFILSILLIACCGTLTKPAADLGKWYKDASKSSKPNILALLIGLSLGYISWIIFLVDIFLLYKLYRQQRMEEFGPPQQPGQPAGVIHQPAVVIVPQGAKQPAYQPVAHPGQQPLQYPGQQQPVVMMGMPPPAYSQQSQQWENQK
ncbi:hypothetical protein OS493_007720 [Desmophyllum pertusum]|uniref:MARVEL domain-containing protein n=1 Tax=Desmophyllum pertusum TaxID=174260 RepID=A0A9W9YT42_9CNID|nr:hypothetical protein OS493_007720 [Desmophyllum pertusum]